MKTSGKSYFSILGTVCIVFGVLSFLVGMLKFNNDNEFLKNAEKATAVVTNVEEVVVTENYYDDVLERYDNKERTYYDVALKFNVGNEEVNAGIQHYTTCVYIGQKLTIYYDKNDYHNVRAQFISMKYMVIISGVLVLAGLVALLFSAMISRKKKAYLRR